MTSVSFEPCFHFAALLMDKNFMPSMNGARLHAPTIRNHPPHLRKMATSSILTLPHIGFSAKSRRPSKQNHSRQLNRRNCRISASRDSDILYDTPFGVDVGGEDRVRQIFSIAEFEEALETAKNKLVVIEFAASHSARSAKIYPAMVDLSRRTRDVEFYIVMGDLSEDMKSLCARFKITTVPYFIFFKGGKLVHEEEGLDSERLQGDVLYYGDNDAPVHQLRCSDDVEALLQARRTVNDQRKRRLWDWLAMQSSILVVDTPVQNLFYVIVLIAALHDSLCERSHNRYPWHHCLHFVHSMNRGVVYSVGS